MKPNNMILLAAAIAALAAGCKSNDYDDGTTPLGNAAWIDAAETAPETRVTFKKTVTDLDRTFAVKLVSPAPSDMTADFRLDEAAVATYNHRNGTQYELLPAQYYDLPQTNTRIEAGKSVSEDVTIHFKSLDGLEIDETYLFPRIARRDVGGHRATARFRNGLLSRATFFGHHHGSRPDGMLYVDSRI